MVRRLAIFLHGLDRPKKRTLAWAREVVATIPLADLPNHAETFADCAIRSKNNKEAREMHWLKFRCAIERLDELLRPETTGDRSVVTTTASTVSPNWYALKRTTPERDAQA